VKPKISTSSRTVRRGSETSAPRGEGLDFGSLLTTIRQVHKDCVLQAGKAVNVTVTLRNWVIGFYIREYEQNGSDRAAYGSRLLDALSEKLVDTGVGGLAARTLRQCRQFYLAYPAIWQTLSAKSSVGSAAVEIWQALSAKFFRRLPAGVPAGGKKLVSLAPGSSVNSKKLLSSLSFSHFAELITIDDPLKRTFYEVECLRGNWSVRELKRQIGALYFERSGLSKDPKKLAAFVKAGAEPAAPQLNIRDPYVFEFLGIKSREVMSESDLEDGLLDKLQDFLLELGHGFCFEARQKRILIGQTHGFVDLVFYHRILKCHVLVELKVDEFKHEHLGQLNTYVSWFKRNVMAKGDNPPVGLLLCTRKDHSLVEYALADLPNRLFVSKYQLELPSREQIQRFLDAQIREVSDA
jgi:predicted nuclease of restriction endonuclease-like (RecB) superfamily